MKKFFGSLNTPKKLGAAAFLLGTAALFAGDPYDHSTSRVSSKELSLIVENKVDHITSDELAEWIIKGRSDFRLIDLNEPAKFGEYHIPGAENVSITGLTGSDLMRNEKIILYSDGGIHAAQAWMLMKAKGYKAVYTLFGGLEEWKSEILFPELPPDYTALDSAAFEKKKYISQYFGGTPQSPGTTSVDKPVMELPKVQMPSGSSGAVQKKKKKEGC